MRKISGEKIRRKFKEIWVKLGEENQQRKIGKVKLVNENWVSKIGGRLGR